MASSRRMVVHNELERVCKEAAMPKFDIVSRGFLGGTEETLENCRPG
jgi:hypothetical protein